MSRVLVVTWDGAGNLVPTLGIAARLARDGHDVRLLGHRSIDRRCGAHGWRFRAFARTADVDSTMPHDVAGESAAAARLLWFSGAVAEDLREELAHEAADVVVADCMLFGALSAGEALGVPTVALFHGAFSLFRGGPFAAFLAGRLPALNALRRTLGVAEVARVSDVHDRCALSLVAAPQELEPEPELPRPANVRFVGPILDAPPLAAHADPCAPAPGGEPLVLVSFSTSHQDQRPVLQRIVGALGLLPVRAIVTTGPALDPASLDARANVQVVRFTPHHDLLPHASLVVTHAGLGTVMSALAHGVPLLCLPLGRDQHFNAARAAAVGAGRSIAAAADEPAIAAAIRDLLADDAACDAARAMARIIAGYGGAAAAAAAIGDLEADDRGGRHVRRSRGHIAADVELGARAEGHAEAERVVPQVFAG